MAGTNGGALVKAILEASLFPKALKYGGYDKIPTEEVMEATKVALATIVALTLREAIETAIGKGCNSKE